MGGMFLGIVGSRRKDSDGVIDQRTGISIVIRFTEFLSVIIKPENVFLCCFQWQPERLAVFLYIV
jgi:hypothetical protein